MAKKSKTQKAKASAARQAKKAQALELNENINSTAAEESATKRDKAAPKQAKKAEKTEKTEKPKKKRFQFLRDVKAELKRVTWPTKQEVLRWTGVVIAALLFFGIFVAVLDNIIVTPLIVFISGIGA